MTPLHLFRLAPCPHTAPLLRTHAYLPSARCAYTPRALALLSARLWLPYLNWMELHHPSTSLNAGTLEHYEWAQHSTEQCTYRSVCLGQWTKEKVAPANRGPQISIKQNHSGWAHGLATGTQNQETWCFWPLGHGGLDPAASARCQLAAWSFPCLRSSPPASTIFRTHPRHRHQYGLYTPIAVMVTGRNSTPPTSHVSQHLR